MHKEDDDISMRILNVLHSLDQRDGGPIRAVFDLSAMSLSHGVDTHILGFGELKVPDNPLPPEKVHPIPTFGSRGYRYSPGLRTWTDHNLSSYDGVVLHGMWLYPNFALAAECQRRSIPYACFPHGMLEPWSFYKQGSWKTLKKFCYWHAIEKSVFTNAHRVLFTSRRELQESKKTLECKHGHSIVVPYGVRMNTASTSGPYQPDLAQPAKRKVALFLGRLHPHKSLEMLLRAWGEAGLSEDWHLIVAGPSEPHYLAHLKQLRSRLGLEASISFVGPVAGTDKNYLLNRAQWFLLPSQHENFGIAALEAIGHGCPVAISDQVYLSDYLHSDSVILPLKIENWINFMRETMQDEQKRLWIKGQDAHLVLPRFSAEKVSSDWCQAIAQIFHRQ